MVTVRNQGATNENQEQPENQLYKTSCNFVDMSWGESKAEKSLKKDQNEENVIDLNDKNSKYSASPVSLNLKMSRKTDIDTLSKRTLNLDLISTKNLDDLVINSPKSPKAARHSQTASSNSSIDVEDRKTLREALYHGIFHRHRRTIFAVGSFLRMLRSRNSQYNTIRSSSETEDVDEMR